MSSEEQKMPAMAGQSPHVERFIDSLLWPWLLVGRWGWASSPGRTRGWPSCEALGPLRRDLAGRSGTARRSALRGERNEPPLWPACSSWLGSAPRLRPAVGGRRRVHCGGHIRGRDRVRPARARPHVGAGGGELRVDRAGVSERHPACLSHAFSGPDVDGDMDPCRSGRGPPAGGGGSLASSPSWAAWRWRLAMRAQRSAAPLTPSGASGR